MLHGTARQTRARERHARHRARPSTATIGSDRDRRSARRDRTRRPNASTIDFMAIAPIRCRAEALARAAHHSDQVGDNVRRQMWRDSNRYLARAPRQKTSGSPRATAPIGLLMDHGVATLTPSASAIARRTLARSAADISPERKCRPGACDQSITESMHCRHSPRRNANLDPMRDASQRCTSKGRAGV